MTSPSSLTSGGTGPLKSVAPIIVLLRPKEAAKLLKVSLSWLAKARMRGDGPRTVNTMPRTVSLCRGRFSREGLRHFETSVLSFARLLTVSALFEVRYGVCLAGPRYRVQHGSQPRLGLLRA